MKRREVPDGHVTLEDAAKELRVSRITLLRWLRSQKLHGKLIAHRWLIPADEIKRALATGMSRGGATAKGSGLALPVWKNSIDEGRVNEIADALRDLLILSGVPANHVHTDGIRMLVKGECSIDFEFWERLAAGIRELRSRSGCTKEETGS